MTASHSKNDGKDSVRRHTRVRRAVKIVGPWRVGVSLVFGVVATVLVAWWFETGYWRFEFPEIPYDDSEQSGGETVGESVYLWGMFDSSPAATRMPLHVFTLEKAQSRKGMWIPGPDDTVPIPGFARGPALELAAVVARGEDDESNGYLIGTLDTLGYPMRAFRRWEYPVSSRVQGTDPQYVKRGSFQIRNPFNSLPVDLAYVPIWLGLLGNTAIYGLLMYGLVSVPTAVIGGRRRRTNRCHPCGYRLDGLTGDTCPECGWTIKQKKEG